VPGENVMAVRSRALEKAAEAAPDVESGIRAGTRGIGPDSAEASAGIRGWATAAALDKLAEGWHTRLGVIAGHVGEFGPKLTDIARGVDHADAQSAQIAQRLRAW
jgi:hypothetical protein